MVLGFSAEDFVGRGYFRGLPLVLCEKNSFKGFCYSDLAYSSDFKASFNELCDLSFSIAD